MILDNALHVNKQHFIVILCTLCMCSRGLHRRMGFAPRSSPTLRRWAEPRALDWNGFCLYSSSKERHATRKGRVKKERVDSRRTFVPKGRFEPKGRDVLSNEPKNEATRIMRDAKVIGEFSVNLYSLIRQGTRAY